MLRGLLRKSKWRWGDRPKLRHMSKIGAPKNSFISRTNVPEGERWEAANWQMAL